MSKRNRSGTDVVDLVYGPEEPATGQQGKVIERLVLGSITVTLKMTIGRHIQPCAKCQRPSPPPTSEQLHALAHRGNEWVIAFNGRYLSVNEDVSDDGWNNDLNYLPTGWQHIQGKLLCSTCAPVVCRALDEALKP